MMRRRAVRWTVLAGAALAIAGCGLQQPLGEGSIAGAGTPSAAPAVNGQTLSGAPFDWSSVRGHVVVLDFWASWCGPCRAEQTDINSLYRRYAPRGAVFLGVDLRDDTAAGNAFRHDYGVAYASVNDSSETIAAAYDVAAPPTIVLIDKHGNIVDRFLGTVVGLSDDLERLL